MRIRTARQAARLRPIATERARQSKFREGDQVFYGGISYAQVQLYAVYNTKPYRVALLRSVSNGGMFSGSLVYAYPTLDEYEASGVHWNGPPKLKSIGKGARS